MNEPNKDKTAADDQPTGGAPKENHHRLPHLWEAILTFAILVAVMATGILVFEADPHIPMFIGVIAAAVMALRLGYSWAEVEKSMFDGIYRAMQAIIILAVIGMLIGVWIQSGVVATMIYYGLTILTPRFFLVCALIICSITSLATGTSWGTIGTVGLALMGVAYGMGISPGLAAGAILSGAYFGDKMSPLSDTTNLAPAMAGTDVFTHIKFMIPSTAITYALCIVFFGILGLGGNIAGADTSSVTEIMDGLRGAFNINAFLLIPPLVVILTIAFKMPAIPGIVLGIISAGIIGPICQGGSCTFGDLLSSAMNGYVPNTSSAAVNELLEAGGLNNMLYSISLTIIAMMFGGIMESTQQLQVIVRKVTAHVKSDAGLVGVTQLTCLFSNATMPEQYISLVVPGRMYAPIYQERGLHPKTLSNALESAGTVLSALVPWNTCGVFIMGVLGVGVKDYLPYAAFNYLMPVVVFVMALFGSTIAYADGTRGRRKKREAAVASAPTGE